MSDAATAEPKTKKNQSKRGRGRPVGSPTQVGEAQGRLTRCINPQCRSTERTEYSNTIRREIAGIDRVTGDPYTHVVWRSTTCKACGQRRRDRHTENNVSDAA